MWLPTEAAGSGHGDPQLGLGPVRLALEVGGREAAVIRSHDCWLAVCWRGRKEGRDKQSRWTWAGQRGEG